MTWFQWRFDSFHDHLSRINFDELFGNFIKSNDVEAENVDATNVEADYTSTQGFDAAGFTQLADADAVKKFRFGDRYQIWHEESLQSIDSSNSYIFHMDNPNARKVIIKTGQIHSSTSRLGIRVNDRSTGYNNYYRDGSVEENWNFATLVKGSTGVRPYVGDIEIHSRRTSAIIARGAKYGPPAETLDYATWKHDSNNPDNMYIDKVTLFSDTSSNNLVPQQVQVFSVSMEPRDPSDTEDRNI